MGPQGRQHWETPASGLRGLRGKRMGEMGRPSLVCFCACCAGLVTLFPSLSPSQVQLRIGNSASWDPAYMAPLVPFFPPDLLPLYPPPT